MGQCLFRVAGLPCFPLSYLPNVSIPKTVMRAAKSATVSADGELRLALISSHDLPPQLAGESPRIPAGHRATIRRGFRCCARRSPDEWSFARRLKAACRLWLRAINPLPPQYCLDTL